MCQPDYRYHVMMSLPIKNRRHPSELTEADVEAAFERINQKHPDSLADAQHVYDVLTWGEGPQMLRHAAVRDWLWFQLGTKYLVDEVGYMTKLAKTAAILFDELGLDAYAALCRDEATADIHEQFERSRSDGMDAMVKAVKASEITPPDLGDFVWGDVMGIEEANAHSTAEEVLELAIHEGYLVVGSKGWRAEQQAITAATLDADHPTIPGQTWRLAILTERLESWIDSRLNRSETSGRRVANLANRLLVPIEAPADVAEHMAPAICFLENFGDEQALTQAGYLKPAFALQMFAEISTDDTSRRYNKPRSESDIPVLLELREWLQTIGALRKKGKNLLRTKLGVQLTNEPKLLWEKFAISPTKEPWERFLIEDLATILLSNNGSMLDDGLYDQIAVDASEYGWQTTDEGIQRAPSAIAIRWALRPSWGLIELFNFGAKTGDWDQRVMSLNAAGESTMLAMLRHTATGPKASPFE